ncbi:MAG: tetratricopeptide repeat protein, partial [Candidatus Omnitrophica bacterium]|nr:tetratricopeptide repeat protein [Candidatus Omnitrophota bacterium]
DYISQYPKSTHQGEAYFYMGESAYYLEDFLTAVTYYASAAQTAYDQKLTIMAKVSLGWSYMKLEKFKLARQYFDEAYALARDKNMLSDDVLLGRASVYMETREYDQALEAYGELVAAFPSSKKLGEAYLGQANIFYLKGDYGNAVRSYQSLIDKEKDKEKGKEKEYQEVSGKAYFGLAWSYLKMGRLDDSIRSFEIIKNTTANKTVKISALTQIGDAYQDVGEMNKAIDVYDGILRDYPESPYTDYVQYRQGIALLKAEKIDAATLSFQTLKTNFPRSKYLNDADYYLALAYFKKGDWAATRDQAGQFMAQAAPDNPFMAEAHYLLGLAAFDLQDYAGALKIFQTIIKNYPSETAMIRNVEAGMAKCYYKMRDDKEAVKRFTALVEKYPRTLVAQDALIWLGDHSLESADYDTAIKYYEKFIADFPGSPRLGLAFYELGQAHQAKGEYDQAVGAYRKVDNSGDAALYAKARLALADIFSKELDSGSALSTYQSIIATSP